MNKPLMSECLDRRTPPVVKDFGHLSVPAPRRVTLDNGIPVDIIDADTLDVCALTCVWRGGQAEAPSLTLPLLTLNTMREGTGSHSGEEIADILEFNGSRLIMSADSHYSVLRIYMLNSKATEVLPLLPEIFLSPEFPENAFSVLREKAVKNYEVSSKKVEFHAANAMNRLMMGGGHPLARIDDAESISSLTTGDARAWHSRVFVPAVNDAGDSSLKIYLAGKVTPELLDEVNRSLGRMPVKTAGLLPLHIVPFDPARPQRDDIVVAGALQSAVRLCMPTIGREDSDYIKLRLLIMALGGYFGSRLMNNVREDKGYTYGIGAYLLGYPEGGMISIATSTDNAFVEPLITEVREEIARLDSSGFSDDELHRLKQYAMSTLASTLDSPFDIMEHYVNCQLSSIPDGYFERQVMEIMSLTADDLTRVAREYVDVDRFTTVVAGAGQGN